MGFKARGLMRGLVGGESDSERESSSDEDWGFGVEKKKTHRSATVVFDQPTVAVVAPGGGDSTKERSEDEDSGSSCDAVHALVHRQMVVAVGALVVIMKMLW
ncbi:hypothetical protein LOK49_LG12G00352 [Camellia lanceoleosa]|uniref:Uncharacterized protein n=1 Tax=Camellia lanceoleosa TaxID=1840588 RepID=A0ACC0FS08_9ERIC|nr:hypothetical protein LOK49_LG12G00352 [Camellia lanceoleosa]